MKILIWIYTPKYIAEHIAGMAQITVFECNTMGVAFHLYAKCEIWRPQFHGPPPLSRSNVLHQEESQRRSAQDRITYFAKNCFAMCTHARTRTRTRTRTHTHARTHTHTESRRFSAGTQKNNLPNENIKGHPVAACSFNKHAERLQESMLTYSRSCSTRQGRRGSAWRHRADWQMSHPGTD